MKLKKMDYSELNSRQKENYNFQKISAVLADYGYVTHRMSDDWQGADFIAQHIDGETFLKVQLKSRLTFAKKYLRKDIYIAFRDGGTWYLYLHDELLGIIKRVTGIPESQSWKEKGIYHFPILSRRLKDILKPYRITGQHVHE